MIEFRNRQIYIVFPSFANELKPCEKVEPFSFIFCKKKSGEGFLVYSKIQVSENTMMTDDALLIYMQMSRSRKPSRSSNVCLIIKGSLSHEAFFLYKRGSCIVSLDSMHITLIER